MKKLLHNIKFQTTVCLFLNSQTHHTVFSVHVTEVLSEHKNQPLNTEMQLTDATDFTDLPTS